MAEAFPDGPVDAGPGASRREVHRDADQTDDFADRLVRLIHRDLLGVANRDVLDRLVRLAADAWVGRDAGRLDDLPKAKGRDFRWVMDRDFQLAADHDSRSAMDAKAECRAARAKQRRDERRRAVQMELVLAVVGPKRVDADQPRSASTDEAECQEPAVAELARDAVATRQFAIVAEQQEWMVSPRRGQREGSRAQRPRVQQAWQQLEALRERQAGELKQEQLRAVLQEVLPALRQRAQVQQELVLAARARLQPAVQREQQPAE
jgi:hypothetical protein